MEHDKGDGADGLESDADSCIYATNYEPQAIFRRSPQGVWETVIQDPRLLRADTMSVATDGSLYTSRQTNCTVGEVPKGENLR